MSYIVTKLTRDKIDETNRVDFGKDNIPEKYLEYTDVMETIRYMQDTTHISKQNPSRMFLSGNNLYVSMRNGLIGFYDTTKNSSKIYRIIDTDGSPMLYTTFSVHKGCIYIASAGSDNDVDNPPFYIIPLKYLI